VLVVIDESGQRTYQLPPETERALRGRKRNRMAISHLTAKQEEFAPLPTDGVAEGQSDYKG